MEVRLVLEKVQEMAPERVLELALEMAPGLARVQEFESMEEVRLKSIPSFVELKKQQAKLSLVFSYLDTSVLFVIVVVKLLNQPQRNSMAIESSKSSYWISESLSQILPFAFRLLYLMP